MSERLCPHCGLALTSARFGPIELDLCLPCGGIWFDCGELSQLISAGPQIIRRLCERVPAQKGSSAPKKFGSPACPTCRSGLDTVDYTSMRGVRLDMCPFCEGYWTTHPGLLRLAAALEGASEWSQVASKEGTAPAAAASNAPQPQSSRRSGKQPTSYDSEACPHCGELNAAGAAVCWACGKALQARVVGACPACSAGMRRLESEEVTFDACEGCSAVWITPNRLKAMMLQASQRHEAVLKQVDRVHRGGPKTVHVNPACPHCHTQLQSTTLGTLSPRPLSACPKCFGLLLSRDLVEEILVGRDGGVGGAGAAIREPVLLSKEMALRSGLAERLVAAPLRQQWRTAFGYSASGGQGYLAIRYEKTGAVLLLLVPEEPGSAAEVEAVPEDTVWQ